MHDHVGLTTNMPHPTPKYFYYHKRHQQPPPNMCLKLDIICEFVANLDVRETPDSLEYSNESIL
jgi:hypothetical protein